MNILIVEDEPDIQELLSFNLKAEGYALTICGSGEEALEMLASCHPDLVLLDLMLPGVGGLELCKRLRADSAYADTRIMMLTAKGEEADVVLGLEAGADDYVVKPFSPRVLLARIRAVTRRDAEPEEARIICAGPIRLDPDRFETKIDGRLIDLTVTEFKLLRLLMTRPGRVYTRQQIIDAVMGEDYAVTERSVDVQVVGLRKKLLDHAPLIETVRGVGYRFGD